MVEAEVDFIGAINAPLTIQREGDVFLGAVCPLNGFGLGGKLGHGATEGAEVVDHGLVNQHVAVGQEQDALLAPGLPEPPDDLEGGVGFSRPGRHDKQDAVLAFGDGLDRRIDGVDLIVARGLAAAIVVIILQDDLFGFGVKALPLGVACPEVRRGREGI